MTGNTYRSRAAAADGDGTKSEVTLACTRCNAPTPHSTLATLGARCFTCYLAFCRQQQPKVLVGDKRKSARGWAHALKAREEAGEKLSPAVREMWRAAIRERGAIAGGSDGSDADLNERKRLAQQRVDDYRGGLDDQR